MWSTIKAMPVLPKVLIGCLLLMLVAKAAQGHHRPSPAYDSPVSADRAGHWPAADSGENEQARATNAQTDQRAQMLAQFQAQQAQLQVQVKQCTADMQQASNQMAMNAMNGQMPGAGAPCEQAMPQWTAQEAYLETEIYRLQTGDNKTDVWGVTGVQRPQYGSSYAPSGSGGSSGDAAEQSVNRWDRQSIRGNSLYTDETGEQRELPTYKYYFRDRASGELIGSDQPYAPNNGRDYERMEADERQ